LLNSSANQETCAA